MPNNSTARELSSSGGLTKKVILRSPSKVGDTWAPEYIFKPEARELDEFAEMCDFQQFSPESHFTKGKVCSLMTADGRKTLTDKKFIVTSNGEKTEIEVGSDEEFDRILKREFGIKNSFAA